MRKYFIQLAVILVTVILASCNWNPTDIETGRGHGGGDKDTIVNFDSTNREFMHLDMKIGEFVDIGDSKIIQLTSAASPDDSGDNFTIIVKLSTDNGVSFSEIMLTSNNPEYVDGLFRIVALEAYPRIGALLVVTFQ